MNSPIIDILKALRESLDTYYALEKDAERYRYIRSKTKGVLSTSRGQSLDMPDIPPVGNVMKGSVAQHLDAAVDAAMAGANGRGPETA